MALQVRPRTFWTALLFFRTSAETAFFCFEVIGVAALVLQKISVSVEFEDAVHDVIQEIAVVGNGDDDADERVQEILKHGQGRDINVVGRLVEDQNIGAAHQDG